MIKSCSSAFLLSLHPQKSLPEGSFDDELFGAVGESDFDFALFSVEFGDGADAESLMLDLRAEDDLAVIDILDFLLRGRGSYNAVQPDIPALAAVLLCAIYSSKFVLSYYMLCPLY